jgi:hypothetical protein
MTTRTSPSNPAALGSTFRYFAAGVLAGAGLLLASSSFGLDTTGAPPAPSSGKVNIN